MNDLPEREKLLERFFSDLLSSKRMHVLQMVRMIIIVIKCYTRG
jgi:hypothetical protein